MKKMEDGGRLDYYVKPLVKKKSQKGITLLALVITIIILLILAMVSIKLSLDGGLITKVKEATQTYSIQEEKEKIQTGYAEYQISKFNQENKDLSIENSTKITELNESWIIEFEKNIYELKIDGSISKIVNNGNNNNECIIYHDGFDGGQKTYSYDSIVTLNNSKPNAKYALTDEKGNIYTYTTQNKFYAPANGKIWIKEVEKVEPKIGIMGYYTNILKDEDKKRICYNCKFYLPSDCKMVECGLIAKAGEEQVKVKSTKNNTYSEYAITINAKINSTIKALTGIAYMTYTQTGENKTIYSNETTILMPEVNS